MFNLCTFVIDSGGSDNPIIKPKNPPTKSNTICLILSFGFLIVRLQATKCKIMLV